MTTVQEHVRAQAGKAPMDEERDGVWRRRVARLKRRAWRRRALNGFIVWQIFAVAVWLMPLGGSAFRLLLPPDGTGPVRAYITTAGLRQNWSMYAPNPEDRDISLEAKVKLRDGTIKTWKPPRTRDMGYLQRYHSERVHEWIEMTSKNIMLWYPFARYAARRCNTDPNNPPVAVLVLLHSRGIPPPGQPLPPMTTKKLCVADLQPDDLK